MKRRIAAILAADVVGCSRLMAEDEAATFDSLNAHRREIFDPAIGAHDGRIVKLTGDGTLVEFPPATGAVDAALAIQRALAARPGRIVLRIGGNLGDVIVEGDDIYGDGVDIAARLEAAAPPGWVCVSGPPDLGNACSVAAFVHLRLGRCEEALHYARESFRRAPSAPGIYLVALAEAYLCAEKFAETVAVARRILERRPDWLVTRALLAISLMGLGRADEARRIAAEMLAVNPRFTAARWRRTLFYPDSPDVPGLQAMRVEAGLPG